jgi:hypothetical protein
MKFKELHLSGGGMITINVDNIINFIKQDSGTYINFVDGSSKIVKENYETLQSFVGLKSEDSIYNDPNKEIFI